MRVLIAVDGSEGSFEATSQIGSLLRPDHDQVTFFCHPPQLQVRSRNLSTEVVSGARKSLAEAVINQAKSRLPAALSDKSAVIIGHQDARHGILLAARQSGAELIVLGARGLGPFKRLLLGSVSRAVVHASEIPIWVARPRVASSDAQKVLLASESVEAAKRATDLLARFAWPDPTSFTVLTVIYSLFAGRVPDWLQDQAHSPDVEELVRVWVQEHDEELRTNQERLRAFVSSLAPPLNTAKPIVLEGDSAESILTTAAQQHSNLIVIGTRQKWSPSASIFGSVSEAVLNHALCSVLVVPRAEAP
jgi:nucleotide-binding universal stress UspA family protein